jgi:hypothetical protein
MWFKQVRGSNTVISSRLLTDKAHTLPQGWVLKTLKLLMAGLTVSSSDTVLSTKPYQKREKCRLFNDVLKAKHFIADP